MITIKVNGQARVQAKIRAIGTVLQKPMRELLAQEGRLAAIELAKKTQPFGTGNNALQQGRNRVSADIYHVYATPKKAWADIADAKQAKRFWWAIKNGKSDQAFAILNRSGRSLRGVPIGRFDGGALHKGARSPRSGRVLGGKNRRPDMIVTNTPQIRTYIAKKQENVGFGKGGWADVARQLGSIRGLKASGDITANWITRKATGLGRVQEGGSDQSPTLTLTNTVSYAGDILPQSEKRMALEIAHGRLIKNLQRAMQAEMRKLGQAA